MSIFHITQIVPDEHDYRFTVVRSQTEAPVGEEIGKTQVLSTARQLVDQAAAPGDACIITPLGGQRQHYLVPSMAGVMVEAQP